MIDRRPLFFCALSLLLVAPVQAQLRSSGYGQLPLHFEKNLGQTDPEVEFVARGAGYAFFITRTEAVAVLHKHKEASSPDVIRIRLSGSKPQPRTEGNALLAGKTHYLIGNDQSKWRTNVPLFEKVRQTEVYDGIDVVYYGNQGQIEYDFVVSAGSDPQQIRIRFDGAERIDVDPSGDLVLHTRGGEVRQRLPIAYQEHGQSRRAVPARYRRLGAREFGIALGAYDTARPLVIDPILAWSTYLGGSSHDVANAVAVDASGNTYITGVTTSPNFPTANALQASVQDFDAFVTKLDPTGSALVYSTYLGGSFGDAGHDIAVDISGSAYVTGHTNSLNFPTANPIQPNGFILPPPPFFLGTAEAFVTKLNAAGSALVYSTYLGGSLFDRGLGIAVDNALNAYVVGETESADFPTANALQASKGNHSDAFVTKINAAGNAFVYSTFLGGSLVDMARGVAVDGSGSAHVTGSTSSTDFPTANALQSTNAGAEDVFVARLNAAGSALVYSTYVGGSDPDHGADIAIDDVGSVYVGGNTRSTNFPTANAFQPSYGGGFSDGFATKLNAAGTALLYSTYLGGSGNDGVSDIAVDPSREASVIGFTDSSNFPTFRALQANLAGAPGTTDAFVAELDTSGTALLYSTYLGGSTFDSGVGIAVDDDGGTYIAGFTSSIDFPTHNALQASFGGGSNDAFVAKLVTESADLGVVKTAQGSFFNGQNGTFSIAVTNAGPDASTVTVTDILPAGVTFVSATPTQGTCSGTTTVTCNLGTMNNGGSATITLVVVPTANGPLSNTATVAAGTADDPNATNNSSTANVVVGGNADLSIVKTADGPFVSRQNATYDITVTNAGPTAATNVTVTDVLPAGAVFVSATPSQGTCSGTTTVTCNLGTINNGGSATIALVVTPLDDGPLENTATVTAPEADASPANNTSTSLVQVGPAAFAAIPTLDETMLMLLAALLAAIAIWRR